MTQPPGDPTVPAQPTSPPMPPMPPTLPMPPAQPMPPTQLPQQPPYPPSQGYPQPYLPPPPEAPHPYQWYQQPEPPKKRHRLLITILSVVFVLFLGGGGVSAYLLTRDNTKGQATPEAATDGFLTAIYTNHDATAAARYVCPQARDGAKLTAKINEIKQRDSQYELPKYTWSTPTVKQDSSTGQDEAQLTLTLTLRTANEQKAVQSLVIVATRHNGWWVCEVKQGG